MIRTAIVLLSLAAAAPALRAADPPPRRAAVIDPAKADADFAVEGEYAGKARLDGKEEKVGVQVIASGGPGRFKAAGYRGGLPGDGWMPKPKEKRAFVEGKTEGGATAFPGFRFTGFAGFTGSAAVKDGVLVLKTASGEECGKLEKVERKSPTLGAKPPAGAVVLFDGKTDLFQQKKVEDGLLVPREDSVPKFQGCTLHVEFRTPYQPDDYGQGRGNSGVYLQSRYEVQVLDSFGLDEKDDDCGGIYTIEPPLVNMCLPPLSWQTYDVEFTAARFDASGKKTADARMTVHMNGVLIHRDTKLDHCTTAAPEGKHSPEPGPLHLQDHGNPVRFRNIWIVPKEQGAER